MLSNRFKDNSRTEIIKHYELLIRHYFNLGNTDFLVFNKEKNQTNGQADFVFHETSYNNKEIKNKYIKVFYTTQNCYYKLGYNKVKSLLVKQNCNYRAHKLDYIMLCNGYESITLLTLEQLESIIKTIKPTFIGDNNYKSYMIPFYLADSTGILIRDKGSQINRNVKVEINKVFTTKKANIYAPGSFYTVKKPGEKCEIYNTKESIHTYLTNESFCRFDKHIGADYPIIGLNGLGFATIGQLVNKIIIDNTDTLAVKALDQRIRRYISDQQYSVENNLKIEPFNYIGKSQEYNIFILNPKLFIDMESFNEYQNKAVEKVNKTIDMKQYQKEYQGQICIYNGKEYKFGNLVKKFQRQGIEKPTLEAKKYIGA